MKTRGLLFDMDGVLVDTEKLYNRFWREAAADFGFEMTAEDALHLRAANPEVATAYLKTRFGDGFDYAKTKQHRRELMRDYVDRNGVEPKKGARELLPWLRQNGYRSALATASPMERVEKYLAAVGILDCFDAFVCGPDVVKGKPEPDIYLAAAGKLGLRPEECMALEDSPSGILAAVRAGCRTVCIPDLDRPDAETQKALYACVDSLADVKRLLLEER